MKIVEGGYSYQEEAITYAESNIKAEIQIAYIEGINNLLLSSEEGKLDVIETDKLEDGNEIGFIRKGRNIIMVGAKIMTPLIGGELVMFWRTVELLGYSFGATSTLRVQAANGEIHTVSPQVFFSNFGLEIPELPLQKL